MRKSHLILLSCVCIAAPLSAPQAAYTYIYRYAPGVPAVVMNMSVLNTNAKKKQPAPSPATMSKPKPVKHLSHPFFTTTVLTPPEAASAPPHAAAPAIEDQNTQPTAPAPDKLAPKQSSATETTLPETAAKPKAKLKRVAKLKTVNVNPVAAPQPPKTVAANKMPAVPTHSDLTLDFATTSSALSVKAKEKLQNIAKQMKDLDGLRLQIRGFAKGNGGIDDARRMSLSRVLTVRSYLMDKGIKPVRLDVQALGSATSRQPVDRVDLVFER